MQWQLLLLIHVTHMHESCHTYEWVTYVWVKSHMWMGHVTHTEWRKDLGCLIFISHFPQKSPIIRGSFAENDLQLKASYAFTLLCTSNVSWFLLLLSHVTRVNASWHTYEWVMLHIWMGHVTHMIDLCHTYEWVMSHTWMSHVTHMNELCHTYEWVMSHIWMSHDTHRNESWHTYRWVMAQI